MARRQAPPADPAADASNQQMLAHGGRAGGMLVANVMGAGATAVAASAAQHSWQAVVSGLQRMNISLTDTQSFLPATTAEIICSLFGRWLSSFFVCVHSYSCHTALSMLLYCLLLALHCVPS